MPHRNHKNDRHVRQAHLVGTYKGECGKLCYVTRSAAKASVRATIHSQTAAKKEGRLGEYWCVTCDAWHIGHSLPPRSQRKD